MGRARGVRRAGDRHAGPRRPGPLSARPVAHRARGQTRHPRPLGWGGPPDLGDARQAEAWQQELEQTDFPERARSPEEQALAGLLVARGLADYRRALAAWDRARAWGRRAVAPPLRQVLICQAVAAYGLDGLAALAQAHQVVALAARSLDGGCGLDLG